jgi:cation diffusion facilitator CzcD-associated flavoprotein CzcO
MASQQSVESFDVLVVGAGIAGVNSAYYLKNHAPKGTTYTVLERRGRVGGTWDLFRYPGIRSDSDIYTFGFSWNPWPGDKFIAPGEKIQAYVSESAAKAGVDKDIRFHHTAISANWDTSSAKWTIKGTKNEGTAEEEDIEYQATFLLLNTGYYDYDQPRQCDVRGIESFQGPVVHPQKWPKDLKYTNKNVVIIGSGATAVTLVPSMAEDARHVTMLQRSPTYIVARPQTLGAALSTARALLPLSVSGPLYRWWLMTRQAISYSWVRNNPDKSKKLLTRYAREQLPPNYEMDPNFKPSYNPWDQRMCLSPDGDFFSAIRSTKADVVTDTIETVTEDSIKLDSGKELKPDIIVTATGLKMSFAGKMKISLDGEHFDPSSKFSFKACLLQDAPNLAFTIGYANASWTLGSDATNIFVMRLLHTMAKQNINAVVPRVKDAENMEVKPLIGLTSTYVREALGDMPKGGTGTCGIRLDPPRDLKIAAKSDIMEGLEIL